MKPEQQQLAQRCEDVHLRLLAFYAEPQWPNPLPALDELVSTILSQNTNDVNRDVAFLALKAAFPSWEAVRDAPPAAVMDAIRPAGLANQKGPRIQALLKQITELRGDLSLEFLADLGPDQAREWLLQFKGVGPKTAAIVMQYSLGLPAFAVDTHVHRITGRIGLRPPNMSAEKAHAHFEGLFPRDSFYAAHLNLIRLGREICLARQPQCAACPLNQVCDYYAANYDEKGRPLDAA